MASSALVELPQFKGRPGWEFTDLSGLDLAAYERVAPDGSAVAELLFALDDPDHLPDGVLVTTLEAAPAELIERHLGSLVSAEADVFVALNDAGVRGTRVRLRAAGRRRRVADLAALRSGAHRDAAQPADADRRRGGRPGRGLGAVPLGRRPARRRLQRRHRADRRRQRAAALRVRPGPVGEELDLRRPARGDRPRRPLWTGSRSASAPRRGTCAWRRASAARAPTPG